MRRIARSRHILWQCCIALRSSSHADPFAAEPLLLFLVALPLLLAMANGGGMKLELQVELARMRARVAAFLEHDAYASSSRTPFCSSLAACKMEHVRYSLTQRPRVEGIAVNLLAKELESERAKGQRHAVTQAQHIQ